MRRMRTMGSTSWMFRYATEEEDDEERRAEREREEEREATCPRCGEPSVWVLVAGSEDDDEEMTVDALDLIEDEDFSGESEEEAIDKRWVCQCRVKG